MSVEQRLIRLEDAFVTLTRLAQPVDARLDDIDESADGLAEAQENSERKIAALVDAQLNTEATLTKLAAAQERLATIQERLATIQERLANTQEQLASAQSGSEQRIGQLAELQAQAGTRFQELIEMLRHSRRPDQ